MIFKSVPFKTVLHGRKTIKFDDRGFYETTDKKEITTISKAVNVEEYEKPKKTK